MDITGHWLNVKQGSYQVMGSQQNSCCGAEERKTTKVDKWGRGDGLVLGGRGFKKRKARFLGF
jgi:hypothetical protein